MAKAKVNKKMGPVVELPECPVCLETMSAPIFQCQSGHSICHNCTKNLMPPICPICRAGITQIRNLQFENLILKAIQNCPNQLFGCTIKVGSAQMENHVKECIYRVMTCPLGIFGRCSWSGALQDIFNHCKDFHPRNLLLNLNDTVTVNIFSITESDYFMYIIPQGKMIFILTLKIDAIQKVAYFVVQLIGCKKSAQEHIYEIHVKSLQDNRCKVTFNDHCFSDSMDTAEIFRQARCCVMPLNFLSRFSNQKKLIFKLSLKKNPLKTKRKSKAI